MSFRQSHTGALLGVLLLVVILTTGTDLQAVNRFSIEDARLPINAANQVISIRADVDEDLYGFSISIEYERTKIRIKEVQLGDAVAGLSPEWADGTIDDSAGRVVWGVVFSTSQATADRHLEPGSDLELLRLVIDVRSSTATETVLNLVNRTNVSPVRTNVMTDSDGNSFSPPPNLEDGDLTIIDPRPKLTDFAQNRGDPGTIFFIVGENFEQPGLRVSVCNKPAEFIVIDDENLQVTAPECTPGKARIEVCNDFGCTVEPEGFEYPSNAPVIFEDQYINNSGPPGTVFIVVGENFDKPGTTVRVCGAEATFNVPNPQTIQVTAPDCGPGPAGVEVCNDFGCVTDPDGFTYPEPPGVPVIDSFVNNEGEAGSTFFIIGRNFTDAPNLVVRVCGVVVPAELGGGGSQLLVTAPECDAGGCVRVEVCTDAGCDFDDRGFCYPAGTPFIRGDTNNSGNVDLSDGVSVFNDLFLGQPAASPCRDSLDANDDGNTDLSDGVYILNFLFQGGPPMPEPFPEAGLDPTPDGLPEC